MKRSTQHAFEPEEIMAYLDGELDARRASALASHLEHCSECGVLAIRLRQISERTLDFQVEPCPAQLEEPVAAALNSSERPVEVKLGTEPKRRRILRGFAWATGIVAAVLIIAVLSAPNLMRSRRAGEISAQRATGLSAPEAEGQTLSRPLAGRAENSFSTDGQLVADQRGRAQAEGIVGGVPSGTLGKFQSQAGEGIEAPELRGPMVVETASITILASNYDQASAAIERVTAQHRGYVQDMTADTRTGMARSVSATLRVPDKQLDAFLEDLRKLGHVEQEGRNNQEITDQYIDLTVRLRTARATEQRIIDLLGTRTGKLSDVLEAERELARIRGEIESMDGQRANMQHQVSYATVQVQLNEEYHEQLNPQAFSTGTRVRNSLIDGFRNLAGGVVWLLIFLFGYGPSILFWLALVSVPAWFAWRRYRRPKAV
jgi:Domain of unknown function (DUF4349)/Putative zinc-finger